MYLLQLPPAAPKGKLLKQRVVGLVGAECGWECSPITLVAVTTLYLVHGKKAKLLSVYFTLEAGGLPGEKVCATFPIRGSQAFSIIYIHTRNNIRFHIGIKSKTQRIPQKTTLFKARPPHAPRATPPMETAQQHTHNNKHRPSASSAAAPDQS
jgi:hypothetical protein